MYRKSHKKKKRRARSDGRNKENIEDVDFNDEENTRQEKETKERRQEENICYEVKTSDEMGRYLVARRSISPGEVILRSPALAVGPCAGCGLVCLGCYRELEATAVVKCKVCKWPLCSDSCPGVGKFTGHTAAECNTLKKIPAPYDDVEELKETYHALMPLRCLLLKKHDPAKWSEISSMESHNQLRKDRGDIYPVNEKQVVKRIQGWGLEYDAEEVHTVCGVLEVNAFEVCVSGSARALYGAPCAGAAKPAVTAAAGGAHLLAHSCIPSTAHSDSRAEVLTIRAAVQHEEGDVITLCYAYTLQGTLKRREHISHSKFFSCACPRCTDPSELGSYCSGFRCPKCSGVVVARNPLSDDDWHCLQCPYTMPHKHVVMLLKRLTEEYEAIDANDVRGFEGFLHKYRNVLHHTHYLCLSCKHSLSQLYGKVTEYMIHEMPVSELNRKIQICRDLMKVFDVIEPGYSRLRGTTLYELHAPLMILTTRDFEKKAISKDNLRTRLKEIVGYLTESALILGFEPPSSPEGLMAAAARDALNKIKTWEQIIGKIS